MNNFKIFTPSRSFFIGIDSDGTVFDSMTVKHCNAFIPTAIKVWNLQHCREAVTDICKRINLYSRLRGINRFPGLLRMFEDMREAGIATPDFAPLEKFVDSGYGFSNSGLERYMAEREKSDFLKTVLLWSRESDALFEKEAEGMMPFKFVSECLSKAYQYADIVVVSSASAKGLLKDWAAADILKYTAQVFGQETGSKKEQLKYAASGRYDEGKILMIGDAPGDYDAAKSIDALFFPIIPLDEEASWENFSAVGLDRFINGEYTSEYQNERLNRFNEMLK